METHPLKILSRVVESRDWPKLPAFKPLLASVLLGCAQEETPAPESQEASCTTSIYFADQDRDGYGSEDETLEACVAPEDFVDQAGDCDDEDSNNFPGAPEQCDGEDNDCDGQRDKDALDPVVWYLDADGDGHGDSDHTLTRCKAPSNYVLRGDDCDDADETVYPGAPEVCSDGVINDCNGSSDALHECRQNLEDEDILAELGRSFVGSSACPLSLTLGLSEGTEEMLFVSTECNLIFVTSSTLTEFEATTEVSLSSSAILNGFAARGALIPEIVIDTEAWIKITERGQGGVLVQDTPLASGSVISTHTFYEGRIGQMQPLEDGVSIPIRREGERDALLYQTYVLGSTVETEPLWGAPYHYRGADVPHALIEVGDAYGTGANTYAYSNPVVGRLAGPNEGEVYLLNAACLEAGSLLDCSDVVLLGNPGDGLGRDIVNMGDADGDGYDDTLFIGEKEAWLYTGLSTEAYAEFRGTEDCPLGDSSQTAQTDIDGDGFPDLVATAHNCDTLLRYGPFEGSILLNRSGWTLPTAEQGDLQVRASSSKLAILSDDGEGRAWLIDVPLY